MPNIVKNIVHIEPQVTYDHEQRWNELYEQRKKEFVKFCRSLRTKESKFDFNSVILMPPELDIESGSNTDEGIAYHTGTLPNWWHPNHAERTGAHTFEEFKTHLEKEHPEVIELGRKAIENKRKYEATTWYGWRWDNWGTKWNAMDSKVLEKTELNYIVMFETAWSPPMPILKEIASRGFEVRHSYHDEGDDEWHGWFTVKEKLVKP